MKGDNQFHQYLQKQTIASDLNWTRWTQKDHKTYDGNPGPGLGQAHKLYYSYKIDFLFISYLPS
jgi:hypothetical protein